MTERLLDVLPGPAWIWVVAWVVLATARPRILGITLGAVGETEAAAVLADRDLVPHAVAGATTAISFFGVRTIWRRASAAIPDDEERGRLLGALSSVLGPLALAVLLTLAWEVSYGAFPIALNVIDSPILIVILVPIATFLWSYGTVLVGMDRLGRHTLNADAYPADRSLGLRPMGSLALTGFAVYAAALLLYIVFLVQTTIDVIIAAGLLLFGVAAFVLSMWRLHAQMVAAKAAHVAAARALYVEAYAPLRSTPGLATLQQRAGDLGAAAALESRAESIQEWPIDERATRFLTIIVTGVVTGLVIQSILRAVIR